MLGFKPHPFTPFGYRPRNMDFLDKLKERYFIKKQNVNIALTGENLSGKSYRGLFYVNQFSKEIFNKPFFTSFKYETFFEMAKNPEMENVAGLFDEIGSESRSERHWEVESQNLGEILELWGMKKCVLCLTLPNWSKLSGGVKGMIHWRINCYVVVENGRAVYKADILRKGTSYKRDKDYWRVFQTGVILQQDTETDELYKKYFPEKVFNYNEKLAEMEQRFKKKQKYEKIMDLGESKNLFRVGLIDEFQFINRVKAKGYSEEDAILLAAAELKRRFESSNSTVP